MPATIVPAGGNAWQENGNTFTGDINNIWNLGAYQANGIRKVPTVGKRE